MPSSWSFNDTHYLLRIIITVIIITSLMDQTHTKLYGDKRHAWSLHMYRPKLLSKNLYTYVMKT